MTRETFIKHLAQHIKSHYNLEKEELTVVFPNKRAAFYLRKEIQETYDKSIWLPQMISIQEAVTQWSGITLVDTLDMLFELIDIDAQLHKEQNNDLAIFGSQAAQMAKDFDEIDQYGVDAEHLFNYVVQNKKLEIWNFDESRSKEKELKYLGFFTSLYQYYHQLRSRLEAKNTGYYGMITRYLSQLPDQALLDKIGNRRIIFAGFNALTATEETLIDKLVKNGIAETLFDFDSHYVNDPQNEAGHFARRYLKIHPQWLKDSLANTLGHEEKHIHIISAGGNTLQTKALQEQLQSDKHQNTAVVLADENLLVPVLNAIPDTPSITNIKVSMGFPISKTPVNQFIKSYFSLIRRSRIVRKVKENGTEREVRGWYIWPLLQLMNLELVSIVFSGEECAQFDRWKTDQVNQGKFIFEEKDCDLLSHIPDIQQFIKILIPNETSTPEEILHQLQQILLFVSNKIQSKSKQKGYLFLLNQVSEIGKLLNRMALVLERHSAYLKDSANIEILYRLLSSNATLRLNSSGTDGLQIMGMLETRNIDFDTIHILSVNEGILPSDKSQSSFIPHYIRKECGLPIYSEKQAVFAYHFYRLLQNSKDIYLYYNNLAESSGGEPSRFILQIRHELSRLANIKLTEEPFQCTTQTAPTLLNIPKAYNLNRLKTIVQQDGLSPTSLSTYLLCPLKFYFRHIEHISNKSMKEELGANIIGNIIHDTLELLFSKYLPQNGNLQIIGKELFDKEIMSQWEAKLDEAIQHNLPLGFPDIGFNYLNQTLIHQELSNYLQYTSNQLKNSELILLELEGQLRAKFATPYGDCVVSGRSDRIDRLNGITRVIDYKTGKVDNKDLTVPVRKPDDAPLTYLKTIPEKALQLLLYEYMYLKENHDIKPEQVEASIHGLKYANTISFGLKKSQRGESIPFLEGDSFIDDMENMLQAVVNEMFDPDIPFSQTDDNKKCTNCDFKVMCKR